MRNKAVLACALTAFASAAFPATQSAEPAAILAGMRTDMRSTSWLPPVAPPTSKPPSPPVPDGKSQPDGENNGGTPGNGTVTPVPPITPVTPGNGGNDRSGNGGNDRSGRNNGTGWNQEPGDADKPFGPECSALSNTGNGSFAAMAKEPLMAAISSNSNLAKIVASISRAQLTERLDTARKVTLFAPVDDAFEKISKSTQRQMFADPEKLSNIVLYHVAEVRLPPSKLSDAPLPAMQGGKLTVKRSGDTYTVNEAKVLCGNIQTANATVYFIDTVLEPD